MPAYATLATVLLDSMKETKKKMDGVYSKCG